ncbi:MAG: recombination protein O N-terminal domain-containing protein, partial [Pseudomonadota bacterium]
MRINPHDAYLLHRRKYRETSAILDILSVEHGLTSVLLKGAYGKQTKNRRPVPEPFQQLYLCWTCKADLPTVTHIEPNAPYERLNGMARYCGMYVNELIM